MSHLAHGLKGGTLPAPIANRHQPVYTEGMSRKIQFSQIVLSADPEHQRESNWPIEYEMSSNRVFRGYYKQRGAYAPDDEE